MRVELTVALQTAGQPRLQLVLGLALGVVTEAKPHPDLVRRLPQDATVAIAYR